MKVGSINIILVMVFPKVVVGKYDAPVKINHPNVLRERFDGIPVS